MERRATTTQPTAGRWCSPYVLPPRGPVRPTPSGRAGARRNPRRRRLALGLRRRAQGLPGCSGRTSPARVPASGVVAAPQRAPAGALPSACKRALTSERCHGLETSRQHCRNPPRCLAGNRYGSCSETSAIVAITLAHDFMCAYKHSSTNPPLHFCCSMALLLCGVVASLDS
jgi:hypothetical protein